MGTDLSGLESYRMAESLAQVVWEIVDRWKPFERQTIGSQLVRAADSVCANLAESLQYWKRKCGGLSGAGGCLTDDIAARQQRRYGLALYGSRLLISQS